MTESFRVLRTGRAKGAFALFANALGAAVMDVIGGEHRDPGMTVLGVGHPPLSAVQAMEAQDRVMVTGWGGTGEELEALLLGELRATPMRMSDDIGVSMAEAIRFDFEGRGDELPLVFIGRITIATGDMPKDQINAMREEAFHYSGVALLER